MLTKSCCLISLVLLLSMVAISSATDIIWDNDANDGNWNTGLNWSTDVVPGTGSTQIARVRITTGPNFTADRTASAYRVYLEGSNGTLTMGGGSLTTSNHIYVAAASTDIATINMSDGTINIGGTLYVSRDSGSNATINLSGGIITCAALSMRLNSASGAIGNINITNTGTLKIASAGATNVNTYITNGWIKAYGGAGTIVVDTTTYAGYTTVTASAPTAAANPSPANGAANVSTLTDLSWTGIVGAISHNVHFGATSPGTYQTNTTTTTFDPGTLAANTTYYWRIDEVTGSGTVTGDVWSFTTGSLIATNPTPANGATNIASSGTTLSWTAGVSASSHNGYFGTSNPLPSIGNQIGTTYNSGTLANNTTYYWRIDEVEGSNIYTGTVWSFTTQGSIKKGPYLIYPGNNTQMTVLWQLPATQACTLAWGTDTTYSTGSAGTTEYGTDHQHRYTITGLSPGTKYYYRVTAGTTVETGSFRTAPGNDSNSVKFLAYGDTRTNADWHAAVLARMNSVIDVDPAYQTILLHSGDWNNATNETNWTGEFFSRVYPATPRFQASVPIMGCLGNHEISGAAAATFDKYYPYTYAGSHYYSFDYGPVHIAVIDQFTTGYHAGSAQITWLANDLANSTKKWKIIVLHQPGWCAGGSHPNDATVQSAIQPLCEQYGVQVVLGGHNHYYSRAVVNGVQHVTTGSGGAPYYNISQGQPNVVVAVTNTLEFCKVEVTKDTLAVQAVSDTGAVIDTFYINKGEPDYTFVQVTDPQIGWAYNGNMDYMWPITVNKINCVNPAFVVVTGDLVDSRSNTSAIQFYKNGAALIKPAITMYQLPGNHDVGDAPDTTSYGIWQANFTSSGTSNPWFSFTHGKSLFICLDSMVMKNPSNLPAKATEQMSWLTTELQRAGFDHKFVFMHIPLCMTSITEVDGTNNMPTSTGLRQQLLSLFHTYGVEAVFSGHAHYNSYVRDGDLEIVTTSSSNSSLGTPSTPQGFRIIKVYPDHIEHAYWPLDSIAASLPSDFNGDGITDIKDMGIFTEHWLENGVWP